ncbi:hypothetical protein NOF55_11550 [Rhizobiaceae bacterium BDR2-2]|uniref:Transmembrane anchored protein n=1 Tax=Ectorhizobium quercum TaxID=2965071 RepID=A0AAE3SWT1_9HYPH|nr:hypothetical protein [Ectorhizobium quercum]MCX8997735.1 hypothetical protein [Ectorhizobium quercum]
MTTDTPEEAPLLSNRTLRRATAAVVLLVALMAAVNLAGHWAGERIALAGHTDSTEIFAITVGQDRLELPANVIRFPQARVSGPADRIDLYLAWPDMTGYGTNNSATFNETDRPGRIIFLHLSQSTMSRDMSGRLDPIYRGLFEGQPTTFDAGLSLHRLRLDSGYNGEVMLTGKRDGEADYAVRCILATEYRPASNADCQRDIFVGRDLSVLYRFSSTLLPEWREIDEAVRRYVEQRLARQ